MTLADQETDQSRTNIEQVPLTHFVDDHAVVENVPNELANNTMPDTMDYVHSIIEFLERPNLISQVQIVANPTPLADKVGKQTPIWSMDFPSSLIKVKAKLDKLQNFAYLKADIKIKLTINANPTVAGKMLLVYSPYESLTPDSHRLINRHRRCISAYPSCLIDPQLDTTVELLIPFLSYKDAYNLVVSDVDYVTVYLFALTNLENVTATNLININVFANFENIILYGPTLSAVSSNFLSERQRLMNKLDRIDLKKLKSLTAEIQVKTEHKGQGLISEIAGSVSTLASSVGKIPGTSVVTKPVQWVADAVGGVASLFGFSKPSSVSENTRISNVPVFGMYHIKGMDQSNSLALNQDYALGDQTDVFQTNVDEMNFEYICQNPAVTDVYNWKSGTSFVQEIPVGLPVTSNLHPCEFVAGHFQYWRATICFKFSIAKTVFHSGRLEFVFNIADKLAPAELVNTENAYRTVFDLTNDTEITIKIPFISNRIFLSPSDVMGYLYIHNLGDLIYNSSVTDTVSIVCHKWAENVQFMGPVPGVYFKPSDTVTAQIQISLTNKADPNVCVFGKMGDERKLNEDALKLCGGDYVENFRPMLRTFQNYMNVVTGQTINLTAHEMATYFTNLNHIFKMRRGGLRVKAFFHNSHGIDSTPRVLQSTASVNGVTQYHQPYHISDPYLNPWHEISIPYFVPYRRIINNIETGEDQPEKFGFPDIKFATDKADGDPLTLFLAGDDDLSFGWLIGIPWMDIVNTQHWAISKTPDFNPPSLDFGFDFNVKYNLKGTNDKGETIQYIEYYIGRVIDPDAEQVNRMIFVLSKDKDLSTKIAKFYTVGAQFVLDKPMAVEFDEKDAIRTAWIIISKAT